MRISVKRNDESDVTVTEHIPMMKLLMDLSAVLETENNNHEKVLSVIAQTMIERYSLKIFCMLLGYHIVYTYEEYDDALYDEDVIDWAYDMENLNHYPIVINNTEYDEESLFINTCPPSDINVLAKYCMKLMEQEDEKQNR